MIQYPKQVELSFFGGRGKGKLLHKSEKSYSLRRIMLLCIIWKVKSAESNSL